MSELTSHEISNIIADKENALKGEIDVAQKVEQEILLLQREILELQRKKKDLEIARSQANHVVRKTSIELRVLRNQFFSARNSGI